MDKWQKDEVTRQRAQQARIAEWEGERAEAAREKERAKERDEKALAETRARRLAKLEAENQLGHDAQDARDDARLASRKATERAKWLTAHPDRTESEFESLAWQYVRALLIESESEQARVVSRQYYSNTF